MVAGPALGAVTAVVLNPTLFMLGAMVHGGAGAYNVGGLPVVVLGSILLGLLGGAATGLVGGAGVWLIDRFAGERPNGRTDAALAASVATVVTGLFAIVMLTDAGITQAWDVAYWLVPVPVSAVVAASAAGRIWATTRQSVAVRAEPELRPALCLALASPVLHG